MKRRDALSRLSILAGGTAIATGTLFSHCKSETYEPVFFTKREIRLLDEIGETILPETADSPGAKSTFTAHFMDVYVGECYNPERQDILRKGLQSFEVTCRENTGKSFLRLDVEQKAAFMEALIKQQDQRASAGESTYMYLLKQTLLFAYFTSEGGATKALRYLPIPGKYDGNYPFQAGDKSWAT